MRVSPTAIQGTPTNNQRTRSDAGQPDAAARSGVSSHVANAHELLTSRAPYRAV